MSKWRSREEMVEFAIEQEPGSPRMKGFISRLLYDADNQDLINALMALQEDLLADE